MVYRKEGDAVIGDLVTAAAVFFWFWLANDIMERRKKNLTIKRK